MQTIQEQSRIGLSGSGFQGGQSQVGFAVNRLKIKEFTSWSVCFAVIGVLTGLLKFLKLGVTMDSVTSVLFYASLMALAFFIYRIVSLSKTPVEEKRNNYHELN